jgi:hypothetical protein
MQGSGAISNGPVLDIGSYVNKDAIPEKYFLSGRIAEVEIFQNPITGFQVSEIFESSSCRFGSFTLFCEKLLDLDASKFDSFPGSGTSWTDLSGMGNSGTLMNGVAFSSDGNGSLEFDRINDYFINSTIAFPQTNVFSIGMWVKFFDTLNTRLFALGRDIGGTTGGIPLIAYGYAPEGYKLHFHFGSMIGFVNSGIVPSLNAWHHIFVTVDGTTSRIYFNGILANSAPQNGGAISSTSPPNLCIGSFCARYNAGPPDSFHSGRIAKVVLYRTQLSSEQIQYLYNISKSSFA